jgi:hypothetical protein
MAFICPLIGCLNPFYPQLEWRFRRSLAEEVQKILLKYCLACARTAILVCTPGRRGPTAHQRLVLASGSLKGLAERYGVSYPTIRLRLDRLIERIKMLDEIPTQNGFQARVRLLVADGEISPKLGKELLQLHQAALKGHSK